MHIFKIFYIIKKYWKQPICPEAREWLKSQGVLVHQINFFFCNISMFYMPSTVREAFAFWIYFKERISNFCWWVGLGPNGCWWIINLGGREKKNALRPKTLEPSLILNWPITSLRNIDYSSFLKCLFSFVFLQDTPLLGLLPHLPDLNLIACISFPWSKKCS